MTAPAGSPVEAHLVALGSVVRARLARVDVAPGVVARLESRPRPIAPHRPRSPYTRRFAFVLLAVIAVLVGAAWAVSTIVFDSGAETVRDEPAPPLPPTVVRSLGHRVGPNRARTLPNAVILGPAELRGATTTWVDARPPHPFSVTVPANVRYPELGRTGIGVLVQSFTGDGREVIRKYLTTKTQVHRVEVHGAEGVFIDGAEHAVFFVHPDGSYDVSSGRRVGNALIFRRGALTVRIEAAVSERRLLHLARTMRFRE